MNTVFVWERLDNPTRERALVSTDERGGFVVSSTITGTFEGRPIDLDYVLRLRADWSWESFDVDNRRGPGLHLRREEPARPDVPFLDFFLTPATNTLPIRRLALPVGEAREIDTIYFHPETLEMSIERQQYERLAERTYRFSSEGFTALVEVDEDGWVTNYEGLFRRANATLS